MPGAPEIARRIKREVVEVTGLTVSVGVATTKLVAKVGSDLRKPDGLVVVEPGREAAFLAPLEIRRLWGIGPKTAERLHGLGIRTIGELAALPGRRSSSPLFSSPPGSAAVRVLSGVQLPKPPVNTVIESL